MSNVVSFTVPGVPVGKARARSTRSGRHYTPDKTREYEQRVQRWAKVAMAGKEMMRGPLRMTLHCWMQIPASWPRKKQDAALRDEIRPTGKPDASNVAKSIEDAGNGILYCDDAQIVDLRIVKWYAREPLVHVTVSEVAP